MPEPPRQAAAREVVGLVGVRGLGTWFVLCAHTLALTAPETSGRLHIDVAGLASLILFFVMSGFLISLPYLRALAAGTRTPSLRRYTRRRLLRIFPAYVAIFLIADLALGAVYTTNVQLLGVTRSDLGTGWITDPLAVLEHLTLVNTLLPSGQQTGIGPAWSLSTEYGFYAALPLLFLAARALRARVGLSRRRAMLLPALALLVTGLIGKLVATWLQSRHGLSHQAAELGSNGVAVLSRSVLVHADAFAWGCAAGAVFVLLERGELPGWHSVRARAAVVFVGGAAGIAMVLCIAAASRWYAAFAAIAAGALIMLCAENTVSGRRAWLVRLLELRPPRHLGKVSLSVYLWHYPVLVLVVRWGWLGPDSVLGAVWSVTLVTALSWCLGSLTYRAIEAPAMRMAG